MKAITKVLVSLSAVLAFNGCGFGIAVGPAFDSGIGDVGGSADVESTPPPAQSAKQKPYFDAYILKAVDFLYKKYRLLGYDMGAIYTHDLPYGPYAKIPASHRPKTMCVAAQLEVMLTAMDIYAKETGDVSIYNFLPEESWRGLTVHDIKGHIWVNSKFKSHGTADALVHFGMGEVVPFEKLRPGGFINFNRTKGNGHAVTFISFIDKDGKEYSQYNKDIIGFKYFSAQGKHDPDGGGLDYRYAVFNQFGCPTNLPYKTDCGIIYSKRASVFNAGRMFAPAAWVEKENALDVSEDLGESVFDSNFYDGDS